MYISVKTEAERLPAAIDFTRKKIEEIEMNLNSLHYSRNSYGELIYNPRDYPEETETLEREKREWEIMLDLLTMQAPFSKLDW